MTKAKSEDGLTPNEIRFAYLRARGHSQSEAYRQAFKPKSAKPETIWAEASRVGSKPNVLARIQEHFETMRLEDGDNAARAVHELQDCLESAIQDKNWTAVAALFRLRLQVLGVLKDRLIISPEAAMSDADLVKSLAGGDASKEKMIRAVLSKEGFDKPQDNSSKKRVVN